jgi:hypothetical protein
VAGGAGPKHLCPGRAQPDWDFIAELDRELLRVQVKTSTFRRRERWEVAICTRGGNQSWSGVAKVFDVSRCDILFVVVGDGRRWCIPSAAVEGRTRIRLGGPKYAEFELGTGSPLMPRRPNASSLESASASPGGCPSGQRDQAVNLAA